MFAGVLSTDERPAPTEAAAQLVRLADRYPHLRLETLFESRELRLYTVFRDETSKHCVTVKVDRGRTIWFCRLDRPVLEQASIVAELAEHDWDTAPRLPGLWIAIVWNVNERSLRIVTDRLGGAWLYLAPLSGGFAFSFDFGSLARLLGNGLHWDHDTALLELVYGYSPDDRTVFEEITLFPPGSVTELGRRGRRVVSRRSLDFGDRYVGVSRKTKFRVLDEILERVALGSFGRDRQLLSLSAGFDSRYALALMTAQRMTCPLVTFGDPDSLEVEGARGVAQRVGSTTSVFGIPEASWDSWASCIQQLGNTGMVQWSGWAEQWLSFLRERGRSLIIGYLGDALSGKHLHPAHPETPNWCEDWMSWSAGPWETSPLLLESTRKRVRSIAHERFREASRNSTYALPHQEALNLDLRGRQRRWVAGQPNLIFRFLSPVTFFCDEELVDFWTNVSMDDLLNQRLYLDYAQDRFPNLFPLETRRTLARRFLRRGQTLWESLLGHRAPQRPPVVDRARILIECKEEILSLIDVQGHFLEDMLDVPALRQAMVGYGSDEGGSESSLMLVQVTNLLLLAASRT